MWRRACAMRTIYLPNFIWTALVLGPALVFLAVTGAHAEESQKKEGNTVVKAGSTVGIEYTLTLEDGTKVDSNVGGEVVRFEQGSGHILPGLDKELPGMKVGETKQVTVTPEEGYGPVDPAAFTEVPVSELPEDAREAGVALMTRDAQGKPHRLRVEKIEGDKATLDFNHPFAGKTLIFDVKIVEIR
jgi:FKBP-type peptidyl-prolyl cis-trans isomerase SlyD